MNKISTLFSACLLFGASQAVGQSVVQKCLIEEHTGAWCGYCPDGALVMDDVLNTYPNAIGVAVHNGDAMVTADGNYLSSFYISGYPSATINREGAGESRSVWMSKVSSELGETPTVSVSFDDAYYDLATSTLTVTVRAEFVSNETGNLRLNVVLVEDDVTGTSTGYSQVNYYNTTAGHPMYGLGNPIAGYVHNHVARAWLGGAWGTNGVITASPTAGSAFTHTYTRVFPASWDINNMKIVAFVSRYNGSQMSDREILNSEEITMATVLDQANVFEGGSSLNVFPNPANTRTSVEFSLNQSENITVEVFNLMGQKIATLADGWMAQGAHTQFWTLTDDSGNEVADGMYLVKLSTASGQSAVKRVNVAR